VFANQRNGSQEKYLTTFWNIDSAQEQGIIEADLRELVFAPGGRLAGYISQEKAGFKAVRWHIDPHAGPAVDKELIVANTRVAFSRVAFSPDLAAVAVGQPMPNGMQ